MAGLAQSHTASATKWGIFGAHQRGAFNAQRHLADADVRTFLRQLVDVVVHCTKHRDGSRTISEVYFDPAAKFAAAPSPALAAE